MKRPKNLVVGAALMLASTVATGATINKGLPQRRDVNVSQLMRRMAPNTDVFSSPRVKRIGMMNAKMGDRLAEGNALKTAGTPTPAASFGPTEVFGDIDGPNGELWYYTADLISTTINHEYYTEYILAEYQFNIYDAKFNLVGTIHDKMRYADDEVRVPGPAGGIDILPKITKNFFNTDNKYEVVVSIAVNSTTPGQNHYRSVVYSIDGQKETVTINRNGKDVKVEVDKPVCQYPGFISDVLDVSTDDEENVYVTFEGDIDLSGLEPNEENYWNYQTHNGLHYTTYSKVNAEGKLTKVLENKLPTLQMQGDMESSMTMLSLSHKGEPYMVCPRYREPFFNRYDSGNEDITMRDGNFLDIKLYKLSRTGSTLVSTTSIPVVKIEGAGILFNFYSVGDLRYSRDVSFDESNQPLYVVSRSNYTTGSDEVSGLCYYVYDVNGNIKKTIFEGADGDLSLSSIDGLDDQHMFISYDEELGYVYNMVNLNTGDGKNTVKIPYLLNIDEDDPDILIVNMDRVPVGNSYQYAFEIKAPAVDEEENDVIRAAWFNADGKFDRIDGVNMGKMVNYGQLYMDADALNPKLVDDDEGYEYMVLVKRAEGEGTSESHEELIIAKPESSKLPFGKTLLQLGPDDQKGALRSVGIYPGAKKDSSRLMVFYGRDDYRYTADYYDLPLQTSGIGGICADGVSASALSFDGKTISAAGDIKVFNTKGMLVASGNGSVAVDALPAGVYVATAGESVNKFIIR